MPDITLRVGADTGGVESVLRVIAKHAVACADELAALRSPTTVCGERWREPGSNVRSWKPCPDDPMRVDHVCAEPEEHTSQAHVCGCGRRWV